MEECNGKPRHHLSPRREQSLPVCGASCSCGNQEPAKEMEIDACRVPHKAVKEWSLVTMEKDYPNQVPLQRSLFYSHLRAQSCVSADLADQMQVFNCCPRATIV